MNLNSLEYVRPDHPLESASILSKWTFYWLKDFFALGLKRPIEEKDVFQTLKAHESKKLTDHAAGLWELELARKRPSLYNVLSAIYVKRIMTVSVLFTVLDVILRYA